jgi:hypothetical protein
MSETPKVPELLDLIVDKVLAYKPKPVSVAQKRLARKAKKAKAKDQCGKSSI